jgi:putative nucleotidyltransferase with HDIG domain
MKSGKDAVGEEAEACASLHRKRKECSRTEHHSRTVPLVLDTYAGTLHAPFFLILQEGWALNPATYEILTRRAKHLGTLPAMPVILTALTDALSVNASKVNVDKIVQTISYDKSLAAQCLRMANSALFRQRGDVATVRDAVLAVGLWRIRDLAFSCNLPLMFSSLNCVVAKENFWRHALATAFLAKKLGSDFGNAVNEQIYLAGLLHDIGILVNALLFPEDFRDVMEEAVREHTSVASVEHRLFGFTHAESGRIVAELWGLPVEVSEVIEFHHRPEAQPTKNEVTVIVGVANQLCWKSGLGYGYSLPAGAFGSLEETLGILAQRFPKATRLRGEDCIPVLETYVAGARELAERIFGVESKHGGTAGG